MTGPSDSRSSALLGLVYLLTVALLIAVSIAAYRKDFPWQHGITISLITPNAGLQLNPQSDVKLNGLRVGEVSAITSDGHTATVRLNLDLDQYQRIPASLSAAIVPTTLFGAKYVELIPAPGPRGSAITGGAIIRQSTTAVEINQLYTHTEAVLQTLRPDRLSLALGSMAQALQGRGHQLGQTATLLNRYLIGLNPHLPVLLHGIHQLTPTADYYTDAAPDLLATLDNTSAISTDLLLAHQHSLSPLLHNTTAASDQLHALVNRSGHAITTLTRDSRPVLGLLAHYSPEFPCLIDTLNLTNTAIDHVVGGEGPYLTATVDAFTQQPPYTLARDLPANPRSTANNDMLPRGVPSWAPHCATTPSQLRDLRDIRPYGDETRAPVAPPRPSGPTTVPQHSGPGR